MHLGLELEPRRHFLASFPLREFYLARRQGGHRWKNWATLKTLPSHLYLRSGCICIWICWCSWWKTAGCRGKLLFMWRLAFALGWMKRFILWVQNWSADDILWLVFHCMSSTLRANEGGHCWNWVTFKKLPCHLYLRRWRTSVGAVDGKRRNVEGSWYRCGTSFLS